MKITIAPGGRIITGSYKVLRRYITVDTREVLLESIGETLNGQYIFVEVETKHFKGAFSFNRVPGNKTDDYIIYETKFGKVALCREGLTVAYGKIPRRAYAKVATKEES